VGDLWKDYSFVKGKAPFRPEISVILPTFRRAASGLLQRAVRSVLEQSFDRLELIVVDDGSRDATADYLRSIAAEDSRVSYYRFEKNSGLPAAAVDFGIMNSNASVLAFMFDDDVLYRDALGSLFREISKHGRNVVYGKVRMFYHGPASGRELWTPLGDVPISYPDLLRRNMISNNAVMIRREVLDRVGMYDPHILIRRLSDWDLWRRVARLYPMFQVDRWIGEIWGPATADSLGATVRSNWELMLRYMMIERDQLLKPAVITGFVVNDLGLVSKLPALHISIVQDVLREYYAQVGDRENLALVPPRVKHAVKTDYPVRRTPLTSTVGRIFASQSTGRSFGPIETMLVWVDWANELGTRLLTMARRWALLVQRYAALGTSR